MKDKIIKMVNLPSGCTALALEVSQGTLGLEIGSGVIFLSQEDIPKFLALVKEADRHFLVKP